MEREKKLIRLDKMLKDMNIGTRSEVKKYIKAGRVRVNQNIEKNADIKIDVMCDKVFFDDKFINYHKYEYIMLNKPKGVITATKDNNQKTVMDLIDSKLKDLFPVGRLDKDTEGLLIITNDGELAHGMLSPKKHVDKKYYAKIDGLVTQKDVIDFKNGLDINEKKLTLSSKLEILKSSDISEVLITIKEGKYHQIKRMFMAVDKKVIYLKRLSMGDIVLDDKLGLGEYRKLNEKEIALLQQYKTKGRL